MYLFVSKVLYYGRKTRKTLKRLIHGALQISMETRNDANVGILELLNFLETVFLA